ncbi:hypothetical protein [Roseibacillus persicicus]|uniref:Uncharacterized protein n=1 Tax=Roseibacillus persicicus TaxID=454148 RepID=A0A918TU79_9BACT|nr:hypothetical protein [Roseibacillus persicicus]GHC62107.1 hypothetical protein GCM10007100_31840 [Roseibacillus persicicus]
MMVLLSLIATGLLSLSALTLRSVSQTEKSSVARANALLAMNIAIGELQRAVGPDQAVTAMSDIEGEDTVKRNLVGVWESWDYNPESAPDYEQAKTEKFRRWLVSSADEEEVEDRSYVSSPWETNSVELVGEGALGAGISESDKAYAERVTVRNAEGESAVGAYAWHVADESVKAKINQYRDPRQNDLYEKRALLGGHRPIASVAVGADGTTADFLPVDFEQADYDEAQLVSGKLVDINQYDLLGGSSSLKPFRNHLTPYSKGVLADVRLGGLKKDLSSLFEMDGGFPAELGGQNGRLYESTHGITGPSDPYWSALAGYHNIYQKLENEDGSPTLPVEVEQSVAINNLSPRKEFSPVPVLTKIEMLYSFVNRDSHWWGPYMGHLVYTPLVTLHNPYNMSISFDRMKVAIGKVPFGVRLNVNRRSQSLKLVPLNDMFVHSEPREKEGKFLLDIAKWPSPFSSQPRGSIVLKPGQSLICGPYLDPNSILAEQIGDSNPGVTQFTNWGNQLVDKEMKARPGFYGRCVGFDLDWITPTHAPYDTSPTMQQDGQGVCLLKDTDMMSIDFGFVDQASNPTGQFKVEAEVYSNGNWVSYGGLDFRFNDEEELQDMIGKKSYRYPASGSFSVMEAYVPNSEPIKDHARAKTFAVFSAYARTTNGGVYETGSRDQLNGALNSLKDGRLAGKPFLHHNPATPVVSIDLATRKPGGLSHEMNLQEFASNGDAEDYLTSDAESRTPIIHGNSSFTGIKNGTLFELPSGPMLAISDFRRSNALSSSYLPSFVQPVANSGVSPLMDTDRVVQSNTEISSAALLDHSVLANHALYDSFYFSSVAARGARSADDIWTSFLAGDEKLPSQSFEPYLPGGMSRDEAEEEFQKQSSQAYEFLAEYQMTGAPFNVNSTSVEAWKAVLSSLSGSEIVTLWGKDGSLEEELAVNAPILPMTLPNGSRVGTPTEFSKVDDEKTNEWNGYRELNENEIESLAKEIVEEVRLRGPFLSMSEFVNRRVGGNSELSRAGALHAAIERSQINEALFADQIPIELKDVSDPATYPYATPEVVVGNPAEGAPSWITQGDIMKLLEPGATVRSDTFVIRTLGEAWDQSGRVVARAYAEAVVQRFPDYVDSSVRPSEELDTTTPAGDVNSRFGRRIKMVSFRWLKASEV